MTKKIIGYVELEWNCPNCGTKNPGLKKICSACGSPQPQDVQFGLGDKADLIVDKQTQSQAVKGPDIHCPYCNTRNTADAKVCVQCGGDLIGGLQRESGRVLSAAPAGSAGPISCPHCGTSNPAGSTNCSACGAALTKSQAAASPAAVSPVASAASAFRPWMALPILAVLMICCLVGFLFFRTTAVSGVVQNVEWQRTIALEEQRPVTREAWRDELPVGVDALACRQQYRRRQDTPVAGAKEVCSTQLVDQGNGSAKVEETCYYEVYDDYCQYQALEWQTVDQAIANGTDLQPYWPQVNPKNGQRQGTQNEVYKVLFETKDGVKEFTTSDAALFAQLQPGTQWTLAVNTLGAIVEVSP